MIIDRYLHPVDSGDYTRSHSLQWTKLRDSLSALENFCSQITVQA